MATQSNQSGATKALSNQAANLCEITDESGKPLQLGGKYHVKGLNHKAYFVLLGVNGKWAMLGYPKKTFRKPFTIRADRLFRMKGKRIK